MLNKSKHPLYMTWVMMNRRCTYEKSTGWENYGGRGIRVCERWQNSFVAFLEDMGDKPTPKHTIDRYPNHDGNYEPGNCRWATRREQMLNTRRTLVVVIEGQEVLAKTISEQIGKTSRTVAHRVEMGRPIEEIMSTKHLGGHRFTDAEREKAYAPRRVQTHCKRGHEFTEENTYLSNGRRHCRICVNAKSQAWRDKIRAQGFDPSKPAALRKPTQ